ncbi:MAG: twin-arginine translocase TatA/TatE family subunit [Acidimicrobiia bacterium]
MSGIGAPELLIILVVVLLLFGSTRLPKLARSLGQASREFKEGVKEGAKDEAAKPADPNERITMTRAELDALLERERKARENEPPAS